MKVLFAVDSIYPITNAAAVRIHSFIRHPALAQAEVIGGVTGDVGPGKARFHLIPRTDARKGWQFLFSWVSFLLRFHGRLWSIARSARFDVIVISVPKYELLWTVPILRRYCTVMTIDVRDSSSFVDYTDHLRQFLPRLIALPVAKVIRGATSRLLALQFKSANLISVANDGIRASIGKWACKAVVVANGVDTQHFNPQSRARCLGNMPLHLVYMGNFALKDQFEWVYSAVPDVSGEICINLVGDGRRKQSVCRRLDALDIKYRDHGAVNHRDIPELLDSMHVGFLFRDSYADASIPVAFFEFASMNVPVICNDVGISGAFVKEHDCGFVIASRDELITVLADIIRMPAVLERFSQLHSTAKDKFSRDVQADRFVAELRQTLALATSSGSRTTDGS